MSALRLALRQAAGRWVAQRPAAADALRRFTDATPGPTEANDKSARDAHISRLLYRSKQRGWLELDLLIGMWAEQNVPHMSEEVLKDYEVVLDEENPDLFKWLTDQLPAPEYLTGNKAYQLLSESVRESMDKHSIVGTRATQGAAWVRGWDDIRKDSEAEPQQQ